MFFPTTVFCTWFCGFHPFIKGAPFPLPNSEIKLFTHRSRTSWIHNQTFGNTISKFRSKTAPRATISVGGARKPRFRRCEEDNLLYRISKPRFYSSSYWSRCVRIRFESKCLIVNPSGLAHCTFKPIDTSSFGIMISTSFWMIPHRYLPWLWKWIFWM